MKTDQEFHQQIESQADEASRRAAMLSYADALREWGDDIQADGWTWLAEEKRAPAYSTADEDYSWFEEGPGFPTEKPHVLVIPMFKRLDGGKTYDAGWREYPTRIEAEIFAAKAYRKDDNKPKRKRK